MGKKLLKESAKKEGGYLVCTIFFLLFIYSLYISIKKNSKPKIEKQISEVHKKEQKALTYLQQKFPFKGRSKIACEYSPVSPWLLAGRNVPGGEEL